MNRESNILLYFWLLAQSRIKGSTTYIDIISASIQKCIICIIFATNKLHAKNVKRKGVIVSPGLILLPYICDIWILIIIKSKKENNCWTFINLCILKTPSYTFKNLFCKKWKTCNDDSKMSIKYVLQKCIRHCNFQR